jgi:hypothetical protein
MIQEETREMLQWTTRGKRESDTDWWFVFKVCCLAAAYLISMLVDLVERGIWI